MAENGVSPPGALPGTEISAVKEALHAQQQLLQKLYAELDKEREASATAASEALSMILRLQGEKAAVKMEADQYKRMAEERMSHAEQSLEVLEDVIRQKEMEIASLEFQVLAYRCQPFSLGCRDVGVSESKFMENLFLQRCDLYGGGGKGLNGNVRRMNSLPPLCSKGLQRKKVEEAVENKFVNFENGDLKSYWERIKVLGDRVEELSDCSDSAYYSIISSRSESPCYSSSEHRTDTDHVEYSNDLHTKEDTGSSAACSVSVHDVFEVPRIDRSWKDNGDNMKDGCISAPDEGGHNRLGKSDSDHEADADWIKKMLTSLNNDKVHSKSKEITSTNQEDNQGVTPQLTGDSEFRNEIQVLGNRVEQLEKEKSARSEGLVREELKMLKEIREQLSLIRKGEIRQERPREDPQQRYQLALLSLQEAMLHFWL